MRNIDKWLEAAYIFFTVSIAVFMAVTILSAAFLLPKKEPKESSFGKFEILIDKRVCATDPDDKCPSGDDQGDGVSEQTDSGGGEQRQGAPVQDQSLDRQEGPQDADRQVDSVPPSQDVVQQEVRQRGHASLPIFSERLRDPCRKCK